MLPEKKTYDLELPDWGPYNKGYMGAAHIADPRRGYRFDCNLFPGYYRRSVMIPRDLADCGAKVMDSSADASHYRYRYELEWKDRVYIDADFRSDDRVMTITCDFVNDTDLPESLTLNAVMGMQRSSDYRRDVVDLDAVTGKDTRWVDAVDYDAIESAQKFAWDGLKLGEFRGSGFTGGRGIAAGNFGPLKLTYHPGTVQTDCVGLRYQGGGCLKLTLGDRTEQLELENRTEPGIFWLPRESRCFDTLILETDAFRGELDGFVFGDEISFDDGEGVLEPEITREDGVIRLRFGTMEYAVRCDSKALFLRTLETDDVGRILMNSIHHHGVTVLRDGKKRYADLFLRPVFLDAHASSRIVITIEAPAGSRYPANHAFCHPEVNPEGEPYRFSQSVMYATTLSNLVWPIYCRGGYIRHNTPGRFWDSLYTWDSGFLGLGLNQLDTKRAEQCLNTYLTPPGDPHSPCIFHGTPLPTQIFLYAELINRTGSMELMKKYYPLLRHQYRFFADARFNGRARETGLFSTWDIFYNSGGWDDYPPQAYVHSHGLTGSTCPVANVAVTVLCGKMLRMIARVLGEDTREYDEDIAFYSDAVNRYAWDEESGYYGYVCHDGQPHVLKVDGVNANMGMDGVYAYVAGISSPERSARILDNVKAGMFTPIGVSVVDTRAPYYRTDGYWNGSVWMPHQWTLWKGFLDYGCLEEAMYIAETALKLWKRETDSTYNCYEHFMIQNGRGAGFHQFSGLSSPVLMWYHALYRPGTISTGFQTLLTRRKQTDRGFTVHVEARGSAPVILVCLEEGKNWNIRTAGKVGRINRGAYSICYEGPTEEDLEISEK